MKKTIRYLITIGTNLVLPLTLLSTSVAASGALNGVELQRKLIETGNYYFDIEEGQADPCSIGQVTASGSNNIAIIFGFFLEKGYKDFQIAGILGNMKAESGIEPQRLQGTAPGTVTPADQVPRNQPGKAWGLVQWDRAHKMIDPVTAEGKNPNDILIQLDFLWRQLEGQTPSPEKRAGDLLKATTNVAEAALSFETKYERHAGPPQPQRIADAEEILRNARADGTLTASLSVTSSQTADLCATNPSSSGEDFPSKVLAYAWPDYHRAPYTKKKPEYAAAIEAAKAEGRYVGNDGVDCGGFVTTLMIDSGFEPRYNYNGRGGPTSTQKKWLDENWQPLGSISSTADLRPGDVAWRPGHTFVFVGDIPGFNSQLASASNGQRAPMADKYGMNESVVWYRKK